MDTSQEERQMQNYIEYNYIYKLTNFMCVLVACMSGYHMVLERSEGVLEPKEMKLQRL